MDLYKQAFVHKSAETPERPSLERLEFLGDSVINLVVTKYLFDAFAQNNEGFMTKMRTRLVSGKTLSAFAQKLALHRFLVLSDKYSYLRHSEKVLEDAFEAMVGAMYLSDGLVVARDFLLRLIGATIDFNALMVENNFKDILMRFTQARKLELPVYQLLGYEHRVFTVSVSVNGVTYGAGSGRTKKDAEQQAALASLHYLQIPLNF